MAIEHRVTKPSLHKKYSRVMKAMLPRKKTSKLRILQNLSWNQEEDSCYIRIKHFSMLDFCNEINDNTINESLHLKQQRKSPKKITRVSDDCATIDYLTPPATPLENSGSLFFGPGSIASTGQSLTLAENIPLTPATPSNERSQVFTFQDSQVPEHTSKSERRTKFL